MITNIGGPARTMLFSQEPVDAEFAGSCEEDGDITKKEQCDCFSFAEYLALVYNKDGHTHSNDHWNTGEPGKKTH